ncbi:MAG: caspase family protein [Saprospiraceae bacterium]|nr:caspase family protein [Candidatus Vicinibacter affinis]
MKNINSFVFFLYSLTLVLTFAITSVSGQGQTKKAMLIGVGSYPESGGWASINSANDIKLIKTALESQGFKAEHIAEISDSKATRQGILAAIKNDLLPKVKAGDMVYFQFSGHGQQRPDKDGDEIDGLDECIVPYDSPKKFKPGVYEGENLITDDELNQNLTQIREKLGPNGQLLVVLDACHSGTGTRGSVARGTTEVMASEEYLKRNQQVVLKKDNNELQQKGTVTNSVKLSPMVAFFGSAQNQLNYEMTTETGEHYGSLTYALSKWLVKAKPEESYRALYDKIRVEMSVIAPLQQPQAEGELDLEIANGKLLGKASYYQAVNVFSETELSINTGELNGVFKGSEVALFPPDTRDLDHAKPFVTGKITKSFPTSSSVTLDSAIDKNIIKSSWIYITQKNLGVISLRIGIDIADPDLGRQIEDILFSKPYLVKDLQAPKIWVSYVPHSDTDGALVIKTLDHYTLDSIAIYKAQLPKSLSFKIHKKLKEYLHGDFIRKLELEGSDIKVSFKIIPLDSIVDEKDVDNLKYLNVDISGSKQLSLSTKVKILIVNEGIKPAYFTLLDVQPDNVINVLLPSGAATRKRCGSLPDQKILFPVEFEIGVPLGNEVFKLISSDKPIDLKATLGTRGGVQQSPFEKLFNETKSEDSMQTRGGKPVSFPMSEINIYSDSFIIIK